MLLIDLPPNLRKHVAIAIRRYYSGELDREARRNGTVPPPELLDVAELFAPSRITAPVRDVPDPLVRKRQQAAERSRRYRARKRHAGNRRLAS